MWTICLGYKRAKKAGEIEEKKYNNKMVLGGTEEKKEAEWKKNPLHFLRKEVVQEK